MIEPSIPSNENKRLEALRALRILDSAPEERFDRLTRMAKRMFGIPISLVSLVDQDRQWFKSKQGLEAEQTPRNMSFCGHAILGDEIFVVENAPEDIRFHDNSLVADEPSIRFYAGCPLKVASEEKIGTLCLIDSKARILAEEDQLLLKDLAVMAEQEIAAIQMATLDELTLISNRRGFISLATYVLNVCRRHRHSVCLILLDLNDFKPINDTFGHAEGDRALIAFADILRDCFRDSDVFARIGGDEFAVVLTATNVVGVNIALTRLQAAVDYYNTEANRGYSLTFSAGYVVRESTEQFSIESLIEQADKRMYAEKIATKKTAKSSRH